MSINQQQQPASWDIGGEGGDSFRFEAPGDTCSGTIEALAEVQQTDLATGDPRTFANGQPMMMYRVTLLTTLRDPANPTDDGRRSIYLKGSRAAESQSSLAAVVGAVKAATGGTNLEPGATLSLTYIGDGQAKQRGYNAPKLYTATYQRAPMNIGTQVPAQTYQQPVQQPVQAYQPPAQQPVQQPVQAYQQPAQQPVQQPAQQNPWTPEQLAAVKAQGMDPRSVWPSYNGQ